MSDIPENVKAICKEIDLSSSEACWELHKKEHMDHEAQVFGEDCSV